MTCVAFRRERDVVEVAGPDASEYLQGQLSQEVMTLSEGASAWSFALTPAGKVDAWFRVTRRTEENFILDLDRGFADHLVSRLRRFLLRTQCSVEPLNWMMLTVVNGDAPPSTNVLVIPVHWPRLTALDLLGPSVDLPGGLIVGEESEWERYRIRAGIPAMGTELDETTIPGATGVLEQSVSFTKGCYTGQELVARIDSRSAGTPTRLVRAEGRTERGLEAPPPGSRLEVNGKVAGNLTSVAEDGPGFIALAYVKRGVDVPETALACWEGKTAEIALLAD